MTIDNKHSKYMHTFILLKLILRKQYKVLSVTYIFVQIDPLVNFYTSLLRLVSDMSSLQCRSHYKPSSAAVIDST